MLEIISNKKNYEQKDFNLKSFFHFRYIKYLYLLLFILIYQFLKNFL